MDYVEVKDFLEDKGVWEVNVSIIQEYLKDKNYKNPLRLKEPSNKM